MALTSAGKLGAQKKLSVLIGRTFYIIRSHNLSNIGWFESSKGKLYKHNSPSFLNLIVFRIVRILLLKVSEEKVLLDSAARVLSEDVWLSAVFFYNALPISRSREGSATHFCKKIFYETPVFIWWNKILF